MEFYNGKPYREVKRKAKAGDLIKVVDADVMGGYYKNGDILLVDSLGAINEPLVDFDGRMYTVLNEEIVVLEPITSDDSDDTRIATLEATVKSLTERVEALEKQAAPSVSQWLSDTWERVEVPALTRADVIEQAKRDVETLKKTWRAKVPSIVEPGYNGYFDPTVDDVRFVENRKKRTVVALIVTPEVGDNDWYRGTWARGVSKCAPDDVFNVHIGKAIALRRALGLDLPDEYVNAPKPTEIFAGDIVHLVNINEVVTPDANWGACRYPDERVLDDSHDFGGEGR